MSDYVFIPVILGLASLFISLFLYKRPEGRASKALDLARSIVTHTGTELANYSFVSAQAYEKLRSSLIREDIEAVAQDFRTINDYLFTASVNAADGIFDYIEQYFENRNRVPPRIGMYLFDKRGCLFLAWVNKEGFKPKKKLICPGDDIAFDNVVQNGLYFVTNTIREESSFYHIGAQDDGDSAPINSSAAFPMFLEDRELHFSLKQAINAGGAEGEGASRYMFGILSVDHNKKNFFRPGDHMFLSIASGLMTNFLVFQRVYQSSEALAKARDILSDEQDAVPIEQSTIEWREFRGKDDRE